VLFSDRSLVDTTTNFNHNRFVLLIDTIKNLAKNPREEEYDMGCRAACVSRPACPWPSSIMAIPTNSNPRLMR
jgi:hypothetical protein